MFIVSKVQIVNPRNGIADFTSAMTEDTFGEEELRQKEMLPPYNAYSAAGDIQVGCLCNLLQINI